VLQVVQLLNLWCVHSSILWSWGVLFRKTYPEQNITKQQSATCWKWRSKTICLCAKLPRSCKSHFRGPRNSPFLTYAQARGLLRSMKNDFGTRFFGVKILNAKMGRWIIHNYEKWLMNDSCLTHTQLAERRPKTANFIQFRDPRFRSSCLALWLWTTHFILTESSPIGPWGAMALKRSSRRHQHIFLFSNLSAQVNWWVVCAVFDSPFPEMLSIKDERNKQDTPGVWC
jgi:hypothetical protein